ncbi:MAG: OmpA family protein [Pyrinomonadaceae bacterium]|nr:OmpA family protein [Phycisphaerales bacterium]
MTSQLPSSLCFCSGVRLKTRLRGMLIAASLAALLTGCKSQEVQDELGRLTSEREQLREDISRAKMTMQSLQNSLAQPVEQQPAYEPVVRDTEPRNTDPTFGDDTSTSRRGSDLVVQVAGDVLFDPGSVTLKSTAKRTLDRVARTILDRYGSNQIRVEGYTDSDPIKKSKKLYDSNEELSAKRALAVEKYLVSKGLSSEMVYAAAFGPADPKSSKKASRRVEIVILGAQ